MLPKSLYLAPFPILPFTQKFKIAVNNGGKTIFEQSRKLTEDTLWFKNSSKWLYLALFPR